MILLKFFVIGLIYSLIKTIIMSPKLIYKMQEKANFSLNQVYGSLLIIFTLSWPFFLFYDCLSLIQDVRIWILKQSVSRAFKKLDKTMEKYKVSKDSYFYKFSKNLLENKND